MRSHRLAAPFLALGLGAVAILATAGGTLAVSPNVAAPVKPATVGCGSVPLDVEIIVDTSGSMGSNSVNGHVRLYWAQAAAEQLVSQLDSNLGVGGPDGLAWVGLTRFSGTTASVVLPLGDSTAAQVNSAIAGLTATGNTPFKLGMSTGAADLTAHERDTANGINVKHAIIFLSDGRPNPDQGPNGAVATTTSGQRPTQAELNSFLGSADEVYSVAIGTGGGSGSNLVDLGLMQLLAKPSAYYDNVVDASKLPTLFSSIFSEIICPTPPPTEAPTATPTEAPSASATVVPTVAPTATPTSAVGGETATPVASVTAPPTSTGGNGSGNTLPLFALLICVAFGALGLTAVEAQRRSIRR